MEITFDTETIRLVTLFESVTKARVKDCFIDGASDAVLFIVEEGQIGLAIGKNGVSVKHVESLIKKNVKIFEFSKDLVTFVKNIIPYATNASVKTSGKEIVVEINVDKKNKAMVIGRDGKNLDLYKKLLNRTHGITDIVVK